MLRVLIAEDDFRVAGVHEGFLSKIEDSVLVGKTSTCAETINMIKKNKIDLILLDNYMPDGMGVDLIEEIRSQDEEVDIILVSAATEKEYMEKAIRKGVKGVIIKPATLERFIATLERYKKEKELFENASQIDQPFLDRYFGIQEQQKEEKPYAKGIDPLTLEKVKEILMSSSEGTSAEKMGEQMGASRTTARRYLEYLVSIDYCAAKLDYGIVGRPERNYYKK
ncbi:response regulator [Jeotgalibacillus proteolyticus]|uniref:Transcriptional regulatory protein n=1 Tax=Jeotgalibacillus proteolyticus TaxID=2082395 RepID=A0A2S5G7E4_9BACL|nr:response regulator [Jeotgalibacillus proteolyticus]PPA68902.1 DNA-binding response regulator [Jeotgalibacillus proteolyticus]